MGITIEITTSNKVTRTSENTIYNTTNDALTSGIIALFLFLAQIINDIFVSNVFFLLLYQKFNKRNNDSIRCALQRKCEIGENDRY